MRLIRDAFKNWLREKNAIGLITILTTSKDPIATLQAPHQNIDEKVVEEIILHSYYLAKTESIEKGLVWAEIARQASLIGGGAKEYADYLDLRASLLQKLFEENSANTDKIIANDAHAPLFEALECAMEALEIYQKANAEENLPVAYGRISVLHDIIGNPLSALEYRLLSLIGWTKLSDVANAMPRLIDNLVGLFWSLEGEELKHGAEIILQNSPALQGIIHWLDNERRGNLFNLFGSAHSELNHEEETLMWWNRAITEYRSINSQAQEFVIWARLQDYAYDLERAEKIVEYGKHCISCAPNDIEPHRLAYRYQLMAFAHNLLKQPKEAIYSYHRAAEIYLQDKDHRGNAGECLLDAGILEEEIGLIDEAQNDIEKALGFPGGARTFWLARIELAKFYWKRRGNLGAAVHNADSAVQLSIGMQLGFAERAVSLHLSGILHLSLGNNEKALDCFESLLRILEEDFQKKSGVYIGRISWHPVVSPSKSEVALLALIVSRKLNREGDAQYYLKLHQFLASQNIDSTPEEELYEALNEEDAEIINLRNGANMLAQADQLLLFDPTEAIEVLRNALPLLENFVQGLIVAYRNLGIAKLWLNEFEPARDYFNRALQLLIQSPDIYEEIICCLNLGITETRCGNIQAAYEQFAIVIRLKEAQRVSLKDDEQRLLFLQNEIGAYMMFFTTCMELRLFSQALETIEKIKSRVLLDLLSQSNKMPIDYKSLYKIKELKKQREDWDRELLLETDGSMSRRLEKLMEDNNEEANEYIYTPVKLYEEIEATKRQLNESNLLLEMESENTALSFDDIRELCRVL